MFAYRMRLERDLKRWQESGFITAENLTRIRDDIARQGHGFGLAGVLAMLGAIMVGFGVMSFVAANWQEMSKLARLGLLLGGLWTCYGAALWLRIKEMPWFAEAAIVGGIAVFGGSIMLIAQMYHLDGNPPDAVLTWGLGALLAAVLLRSPAALGAAIVLFAVWSNWEWAWSYRQLIHWSFLPVIAACFAVAAWLAWRPGLHLASLATAFWLEHLGWALWRGKERLLPTPTQPVEGLHFHIVVAIGLAIAAAAYLLGPRLDRKMPFSQAAFGYGAATAFGALHALQFIIEYKIGVPKLVMLAIPALALTLLVVWQGWHTGNRGLLWLGYVGFAIEIFGIYFKTVGSLLGSSVFFLGTGAIVILLAWVAWLLHRQQLPTRPAAA